MSKKLLLVIGAIFVIGTSVFFINTDPARKTIVHIKEENCITDPNPTFTHYPTEMDKVMALQSPIMQVSSGVKGHSYIDVTERVPIYAPVDSVLTSGAKYREELGGRGDLDQYTLDFDVTCEVSYFFDHLIDPIDKIAAAFPGAAKHDTRSDGPIYVEIKGGEFLGFSSGTGMHNFDFGVINITKTTSLFNNPEYMRSDKFDHADCPYAYYKGSLRSTLFSLIGYSDARDLKVIENLCEKYF